MSEKAISQMTAKELLAYYQAKLGEETRQAEANGKLVCWLASVAPPKICVAVNITMVYPETHATGIGTRKGSLDMLEVTSRDNHSVDYCSYDRVNMGYMKLLKEEAVTGKTPEMLTNSPAARVPPPDLVITCNSIYNTLLKWYENLAVELNTPYIVIDVSYNHAVPAPEYSKEYIADQFRSAISRLEVICERPFNYEKFHAAHQQTQRSAAQQNRTASMSRFKPSPLNGFDLFSCMALVVCACSQDYAEIIFRKFADELEEKYKEGGCAFKGTEQNHIAWEGIAVWLYLGRTFKSLKNIGAVITGSAYPNMWDLAYDAEDESLHSMAEAYICTYTNTCLENKVNVLLEIMEKGQNNGVLYHLSRSCKLMSFLNVGTAELTHEKNSPPYAGFDGDRTDPQSFTPAQHDTRMQTLGEMTKKRSSATGTE